MGVFLLEEGFKDKPDEVRPVLGEVEKSQEAVQRLPLGQLSDAEPS